MTLSGDIPIGIVGGRVTSRIVTGDPTWTRLVR